MEAQCPMNNDTERRLLRLVGCGRCCHFSALLPLAAVWTLLTMANAPTGFEACISAATLSSCQCCSVMALVLYPKDGSSLGAQDMEEKQLLHMQIEQISGAPLRLLTCALPHIVATLLCVST